MEDFFTHYLAYTAGGEVPPTFHRWSAIAGISALLERNTFIEYGHTEIYPNIYSMLIGTAGTRKSTAIKLIKRLLVSAGYHTIAAERTSKEKYLADLSAQGEVEDSDILDENLFGPGGGRENEITPSLIAADEANDFFGIGNMEFLSVLGSLWDWQGKYENKVKSGKSDFIPNPTITILAGNTPTGFATAFPSTIFGQGFFSRLLLIYSEPTGERITFPPTPTREETSAIVTLLQQVRVTARGLRDFTATAWKLVDKIYKEHKVIDDPRFDPYSNRRLTHLMKLSLIVSAARFEIELTEDSVLQANTYLTYIENLMPKALGEFGKAKDADTTHKVLTAIENATNEGHVITIKEIFSKVKNDLNDPKELSSIMMKLSYADQIQAVAGGKGFLAKKREVGNDPEKLGLVDFSKFLSPFELGVRR